MSNRTVPAAAEGMHQGPPASLEELAALDFAPWVKDDADEERFTPPGAQEWKELGQSHLPNLRMAFLTLFKTKAELVEMAESEPSLIAGLVEEWSATAAFFHEIGKCEAIVEGAQARLLWALATMAMREDAR